MMLVKISEATSTLKEITHSFGDWRVKLEYRINQGETTPKNINIMGYQEGNNAAHLRADRSVNQNSTNFNFSGIDYDTDLVAVLREKTSKILAGDYVED